MPSATVSTVADRQRVCTPGSFIVGIVGGLSTEVSHHRDKQLRREWLSADTIYDWVEAVEKRHHRVPVRLGHRGPTIGTITAIDGELTPHRICGLSFRCEIDRPHDLRQGETFGVSPGFTSAPYDVKIIARQFVRAIRPGTVLDHIALIRQPQQPAYRLSEAVAGLQMAGEIERTTREQRFRVFKAITANGWQWWKT